MSSDGPDPVVPSVAALYLEHGDHLRRVAAAKLGADATRSEVTEVVQEVFADLARLLGDGQPAVDSWRAYLTTMTSNTVVARGRARTRDRTHQQPLDTDEVDSQQYRAGIGGADPTADTVVARLVIDPAEQRRDEHVARALGDLDPRSRRIIEGRYRDGLTNRTLGEELGISGQRVSQLHDQALRRIHQEVTTRR